MSRDTLSGEIMMRHTWGMAIVAGGGRTGTANAGVEGGHFEGTLFYADESEANFVSADFFENGTFVENDDEGVIVPYPGTYEENDFIIFSVWTAQYNGFDNFEVRGVSLFSIVSL